MDRTLTLQVPAEDPGATPEEVAREWAPCLRALGDETRLQLALLLAERPRSVKDLQEATGLTQPLVSHHLRTLREGGVVTVRAEGRRNVHDLCCAELIDVVRCLASLATANAAADIEPG